MKVLMHKPNDSGNSSYLHIWILKYISISSGVVLVVPCLVPCLATQLVSTEYKIHLDPTKVPTVSSGEDKDR